MPSPSTAARRNAPSRASAGGAKRHPAPRRSAHATRVAILGGGRGGRALLKIFARDPLARIVALAEIRPRTLGATLARQLGVPVTHDYREVLCMKNADLIIDVTGSPEVEKALQNIRKPSVAIIGGESAKFMWRLIDGQIRATTEMAQTLAQYQSLFRRYVKEESESAVDEERTRIACEIHDGLVQTLVGVNFKMERCGTLLQDAPAQCATLLSEVKHLLKHGIQEARHVVFNLRPGQYEQLDLLSALSTYLEAYHKQHHVRVDFAHTGTFARLDPKTKVFLFRIIQEALQNAAKHARASKVSVHLTIQQESLSGVIRDNGIGFDVQAVSRNPDKWDHFGLRGIQERVKLLGGEVSWKSPKGMGTSVAIQIPLGRKEHSRNGKNH